MPVMVCTLIYSPDQTQPNTKGFMQTPKAALMCLLFKKLWLHVVDLLRIIGL